MARLAYYAPGVYVEEVPSARQPIAGVGTNTVGFIGIVPDSIYCPVPNPDYDPVLARILLDYSRLSRLAAERAGDVSAMPSEDQVARHARLEADRARDNNRANELTAQIAADRNLLPELATTVETKGQATAASAEAVGKAEQSVRDAISDTDKAEAETSLTKARSEFTKASNDQKKAEQAHAKKIRDIDTAEQELQKLQANLAELARAGVVGAGASGAGVVGASGTGVVGTSGPNVAGSLNDEEFDNSDEPPQDALVPSKFHPYFIRKFKVKADEFATKLCTNFSEYANLFGEFSAFKISTASTGVDSSSWMLKPFHLGHHLLTHAVDGFFKNGGTRCFVARITDVGGLSKVLDRFESIDDVAILTAPGLPKSREVWGQLQTYCENDSHQNVFAILDSPLNVNDDHGDLDITKLQYEANSEPAIPFKSTHAAFYFPHIEVLDPAKRLQDSDPASGVEAKYRGLTYVAPSGHVAGIYARTDEERGVHKAPANASVRGALEVKYYISKPKQELLNPQGVNCIRLINGDVKVWGARTIGGDSNGEWKYVNVRRFAGFLEESIDEGTQWVVFEPNDPSLWSKIILNITAFLTNVWRSGALFGLTPQEAFYVKCDAELNPPEVRDLGQVITEIGVAIVRPAEFVIFRITQSTGLRPG